MIESELCPCHSGKKYKECCLKYHQGAFPETPLLLMRSRYSAYAKKLTVYIIETTFLLALRDRKKWKIQIENFSSNHSFEGLEILSVEEGEQEGFVTFKAILKAGDKDVSFVEKSRFVKENGTWKYSEPF